MANCLFRFKRVMCSGFKHWSELDDSPRVVADHWEFGSIFGLDKVGINDSGSGPSSFG